MNRVSSLSKLIQESKGIAVIGHVNPDGDSIGSVLGLGLTLKKLSNNVDILLNDEFPGRFNYLPGVHHIKKHSEATMEYDLVFVLDCGDANRLGDSVSLISEVKTVVNIDHHVSNDGFGHINRVDVNASSTCELVYRVIKEELELTIDADVATCLYTGIVSDTGSFKYDNTSPFTLRAAADLMEQGVNTGEVSLKLYHSNSLSSVQFLATVLKGMEIIQEGKVAIITMTLEDIKAYGVQQEEMEGLINYCRDIEGVEVAVSLREMESGCTKASFRGKSYFDVNMLASNFGGGGHKKASGATIQASPKEARAQILKHIEKKI